MTFVCDLCGSCCRTHRVPITATDLRRLKKAESPRCDSSIDDWVEWLSPEAVDMTGEPETFVQTQNGRRLLVLRHNSWGCVFLNREGGCSIHSARPSACRTYPFDRPDPADSSLLGLVPGQLCPRQTGYSDTAAGCGSDTPEFVDALTTRDRDLSAYAELVSRWNSRQRTRLRLGRRAQSGRDFIAALLREELLKETRQE
jgi:Fe-S-cluster containining protein